MAIRKLNVSMDDGTTAFYNVFRAGWEMLRQAIEASRHFDPPLLSIWKRASLRPVQRRSQLCTLSTGARYASSRSTK
jgi:hypothetical protein